VGAESGEVFKSRTFYTIAYVSQTHSDVMAEEQMRPIAPWTKIFACRKHFSHKFLLLEHLLGIITLRRERFQL